MRCDLKCFMYICRHIHASTRVTDVGMRWLPIWLLDTEKIRDQSGSCGQSLAAAQVEFDLATWDKYWDFQPFLGPRCTFQRKTKKGNHGPFVDGTMHCPCGSRSGTLCFALSFRSCPTGCSGCVAGSCGRSGCRIHGIASLGLWHGWCSDPVGPSARRQAHQGAWLGGANSRRGWLDRWSDCCPLRCCLGWTHCSSGPCQDPVLRHQPHQVQDCQGQGLHHSLHEAPHRERLLSC